MKKGSCEWLIPYFCESVDDCYPVNQPLGGRVGFD